MPGQPIATAQGAGILARGVRTNFWDTYLRDYEASQARLSSLMETLPSDKDQETYAYLLAAPHARIWRRGESISAKAMRDVSWTIVNRDWGRRITWHKNDRMDDQTKSVMTMARDVGGSLAFMDERVLFQMMTGATDVDLLPAVPTAADGQNPYATTGIGGGARFGRTGGNIYTGGGVDSGAAVQSDFIGAVGAMIDFQDGEGQPLHGSDTLSGGFMVIFNATSNLKAFHEAFTQGVTAQGPTTATSNAGVSNVIQQAGYVVDLWPVPSVRLSDNDWFIFAKNARKKPFVRQMRQDVEENAGTMETSDVTRSTKIEYLQYDMRRGYGVATPFATVQVNNP